MRHLPLIPGFFVCALVCLSYFVANRASADENTDALAQSFALQARGDLRGALVASEQAAEARPSQYFARLRVAFLQLSMKDYPAAAREYARAAALASKATEPLLGQQQALLAINKYAEAEPVGRAILKRDPLNYLGKSRLAWTLYNLKRHGEAARLYREVLELYPGDVEMMLGLGYAELGRGKKRLAAETFRHVLAAVPKDARATAGLAAAR